MKVQTPEEIKQERDALLSIVQSAQQYSEEMRQIFKLLQMTGVLKQAHIDAARDLINISKPKEETK